MDASPPTPLSSTERLETHARLRCIAARNGSLLPSPLPPRLLECRARRDERVMRAPSGGGARRPTRTDRSATRGGHAPSGDQDRVQRVDDESRIGVELFLNADHRHARLESAEGDGATRRGGSAAAGGERRRRRQRRAWRRRRGRVRRRAPPAVTPSAPYSSFSARRRSPRRRSAARIERRVLVLDQAKWSPLNIGSCSRGRTGRGRRRDQRALQLRRERGAAEAHFSCSARASGVSTFRASHQRKAPAASAAANTSLR